MTQELLGAGVALPVPMVLRRPARSVGRSLFDWIRPGRGEGTDVHPAVGVSLEALDALAERLRDSGEIERRVTVVGSMPGAATALAAITLGRALAKGSRVLLVNLAPARGEFSAISSDPGAPGLAELARGEASFGQIITKDRFSAIHLVMAGAVDGEEDFGALVAMPRVAMSFDALARAYNHVVIDAGVASDTVVAALAKLAPRAVLVADALTSEATGLARTRLLTAGFVDVTVLVGTRNDWQTAETERRADAA
jgi:Mrp family chromosome partitioning ATPase